MAPFRRWPALFLFFFIANAKGELKGGKKSARDRWYGLSDKDGFDDFRRWWHRVGKGAAGGNDITSKQEAEDAYETWIAQGRPKVK